MLNVLNVRLCSFLFFGGKPFSSRESHLSNNSAMFILHGTSFHANMRGPDGALHNLP